MYKALAVEGLSRRGIGEPETDAWYPRQIMLDILRDIEQHGGRAILFRAGKAMADVTQRPPATEVPAPTRRLVLPSRPMTKDDLERALARVDEYEAGLRSDTIANRVLKRLGPTRPFVAFYRRFGPRVDPWLFRRTGGRIASKVYGFPALLLVTKGAKTGQRRTSPLLYARDGEDFVVVGTNFGTEHHPAWTANLATNPAAEIVIGDVTLPVVAERVDEATFARVWPRFTAVYPGYDAYLERLRHRTPRMFRLRVARA